MGSEYKSTRHQPQSRFRILAVFILVLLLLTSAFIFSSPKGIMVNVSGSPTRGEEDDGNSTTNSRESNKSRENRRDSDNDGLDDDEERRRRTDPDNPDTDSDGISDGEDYYPLDSSLWRHPLEILSQVVIEISVFLILIFSYVAYRKLRKRGKKDTES